MKRKAQANQQSSLRASKPNWRKLRSMTTLGTLGFIMLFHYQNCAPAMGSKSLASANDASVVTTIDNVNASTGVSFPQSKISVPSNNETTSLVGVCNGAQNGAVLGYKVVDSQGRMVEQGQSLCSSGQFEVTISPGNNLQCGESYLVEAQLASGNVAMLPLTRDCADAVASAN